MSDRLEMSINEASGCADIFSGIIDIGIIYDPEEARHIIACVNALAGIRPDLVEQGGFAAVPVATHREVKQQRDDLLALLLEVLPLVDAYGDARVSDRIRAAMEPKP